MMFLYCWSLVFTTFIGTSFAQPYNNSESRLIEHILTGYNRQIRPVQNVSSPVKVRFGIMLKQIIYVDLRHQMLKLHVWIRIYWKDEFIGWNPEDFGGLKAAAINPENVWTPKLALYNSASDKPGEINFKMIYKVLVTHTGEMRWTSPSIISSDCGMDALSFPFDKQKCFLEFGSWVFDGSKLDVDLHKPYVDKESYSENEEWLLTGDKAEKRVKKYSASSDPFPSVVFTLEMERRASFFVRNVIVPCGLMTFSSLFSFIMPPNSGERVSFLTTVLVAFTVYMMIVNEEIPPSSTVPLASKFFLFLMVQQGLSIMATCFIIRFQSNDSPIPKWFDVLVNKWLAYLLFMQPEKNCVVPGKDDLLFKRNTFLSKVYRNEGDALSRDRSHPTNSKTEAPDSNNEAGKKELGTNDVVQEQLYKLLEEVKVPVDYLREIRAKEKLQNDWIFATRVLDRFFLLVLIASVCICMLLILLVGNGVILSSEAS